MTQEEIDEVAKEYDFATGRYSFKQGVKWCAKKSYTEEEVYHILCEHTAFLFAGGKSTLTEWFEKFKKE
jgi:hypothetical protein